MNPFTTAQLINHGTGSTYYDTTSNTLKYSLSPTLTMFGDDTYDITLSGNTKKTINKNIKLDKQPVKSKYEIPPKPTKTRTRKITPVPDEHRCCANTSDGSQCRLKRCENSGEMCYVHYKKTLPKVEEPIVKVSDNSNSKSKRWSFLKWWQ